MPLRQISVLVLLLWHAHAGAVTVAFLKVFRPDGQLLQLEPNGQFAHSAIRVGNVWLHAYPYRGVELVESLHSFGHEIIYLENESVTPPSLLTIQRWLGRNFDLAAEWGDPESTYCSRLIADLLHIPPHLMEFKAEAWSKIVGMPLGRLGLSPDDLYQELLRRGFKPVSSCERMLVN